MQALTFARLTVLLAVASAAAGCSAAAGDGASPAPQLQLRTVTSSTTGRCTAPPLTSQGPASACDRAGTTTYVLGELLGAVTPTSVIRDDQAPQTVVVLLNKADAAKFGDVTGKALEKQLAILFDGKVLSAPVVKEPLTTGKVGFVFETAAEAKKVATELGASATP